MSRSALDELDAAVRIARAYFEELIGCVVDCGCWQPGWDDDAAIARFAEGRGAAPDGAHVVATPYEVLDALERLLAAGEIDLRRISRGFGLGFPTVARLHAFFTPSRDRLRRALGA